MVENGKIYNDSEKKEAGYPLSTDRVPSLLDHRARRDTVKTRGLRRTPVLSLSGFVKFVISQSARAFPAAPRGRTCVDAATNAPPVYATSSRIINGRIRIPRSREKSDR